MQAGKEAVFSSLGAAPGVCAGSHYLNPWHIHVARCVQVVLAFFEKRKTQRWSLIGGKQEERLYWEQW